MALDSHSLPLKDIFGADHLTLLLPVCLLFSMEENHCGEKDS